MRDNYLDDFVMKKTVWKQYLNKTAEVIGVSGGLTLTEYSVSARIQWIGDKWPMFEFVEDGPLPPNEPCIGAANPLHSRDEAQLFATEYLAYRRRTGWTVDPDRSFGQWNSIPAEQCGLKEP